MFCLQSCLINGNEFDQFSKEHVKHLQDKRCYRLKCFKDIYHDVNLFEIDLESVLFGADILAYQVSFQEIQCKFKDAFDEYCMSHESVINCPTLDLAVAEKLKRCHVQVLNGFNEKYQSLMSAMSMVACSTKRKSKPNLPGCTPLWNRNLPDCKSTENHDFDCDPFGPKPLVNLSSLDWPLTPTSLPQDLPSTPQHHYFTKSLKTSGTPSTPTMETEIRKVVKKASPPIRSSHSMEKARLALEKAKLVKNQLQARLKYEEEMAQAEVELARMNYEKAILSRRRKASVSEPVQQERTRSKAENQEVRPAVTLPDQELSPSFICPSNICSETPELSLPPVLNSQDAKTEPPHSPQATPDDKLELQTTRTMDRDEPPSAHTALSIDDQKTKASTEVTAQHESNAREEEQDDWQLSLLVISEIPSDDQKPNARPATLTVAGDFSSNLDDLAPNHAIDYHSSWIQRKRTRWKKPCLLGIITSTYPDDKGLTWTGSIRHFIFWLLMQALLYYFSSFFFVYCASCKSCFFWVAGNVTNSCSIFQSFIDSL